MRTRTHRTVAGIAVLALVVGLGSCFAPFPASVPAVGTLPALWQVRDASGSVRMHILGSVHLGDERMLDLGASVEAAFAHADDLVLEADLSGGATEESSRLAMRFGRIPAPATLRDRLSPETLALLEAWQTERGIPPDTFSGTEPWLVAISFAVIEFQRFGLDPGLGVDRLFQDRAVASELPIIGLETLERQFRLLAELPRVTQDALLADSLRKRDEFQAEAEQLIDAWAQGDTRALEAILFEGNDDAILQVYFDRVILDRNREMADGLASLLSQPRNRFVVVGAAHNVGAEGIPALLKKRGFAVEQVQ